MFRDLTKLEGVLPAAHEDDDRALSTYDYAFGPPPPTVHRPTAEWFDPFDGIDYRVSVGQGGKRRFRVDQIPGPGHRPGKSPRRRKSYTPVAIQPEVAVELRFPEPLPSPPAHWEHLPSIPELARLRRAGATFHQLADLSGHVGTDTVRAWLTDADFDLWGWREGMAHRCFCGSVYSPWELRERGRGSKARWPSSYCSKTCQEKARGWGPS